MVNPPASRGKQCDTTDIAQLKREVKGSTPTRLMGLHRGRTPGAVLSEANQLGLSTRPTNESP
jgi:hypothetical protein